jgi:hypothetical protein
VGCRLTVQLTVLCITPSHRTCDVDSRPPGPVTCLGTVTCVAHNLFPFPPHAFIHVLDRGSLEGALVGGLKHAHEKQFSPPRPPPPPARPPGAPVRARRPLPAHVASQSHTLLPV